MSYSYALALLSGIQITGTLSATEESDVLSATGLVSQSGPALVQTATAVDTGVTSKTATFANASAAGNLLIAIVAIKTLDNSVTLSLPVNWVQAAYAVDNTSNLAPRVGIFYRANAPATTSVLCTYNGATTTDIAIALQERSGVMASSPFDKFAVDVEVVDSPEFTTGTTPTTTAATELVIAAIANRVPGTTQSNWTPSDFTIDHNLVTPNATGTNACRLYVLSNLVSDIGAYSQTSTPSSDRPYAGAIATFKLNSAVTGTLASTEQSDVLSATGWTGPVAVTGFLDSAEQNDVLAASGTLRIVGAISATEQDDIFLAFESAVTVLGTVDIVEYDDSSHAPNEAGDELTLTIVNVPDALTIGPTRKFIKREDSGDFDLS